MVHERGFVDFVTDGFSFACVQIKKNSVSLCCVLVVGFFLVMKKESKLYVFLFDLNEKIREYIYIDRYEYT